MCYSSRHKNSTLRYKTVGNRVKRWVILAIGHSTRENTDLVELRYAAFRSYITWFAPHYFDSVCSDGCPCTYPSAEAKSASRLIPVDWREGLEALIAQAKERAVNVVHSMNTGGAEAFNAFQTVLTPKRSCYWRSWVRCFFFSVALWNDGAHTALSPLYQKLHLTPFDAGMKD